MAFTLRLPPELEADLKQIAGRHDRSLQKEVVSALRSYVKEQTSSVYTVAYQLEVNRQSSEGEMSIEAKSEARALEFARAELERRFSDAVLLECKVK